jgi:tetratricopeptide (TPR) repeat protein
MDTVIESALQPGRFIDWKQGASFLQGLYEVEREIESLVASNAERAVCLYETSIVACNMKANEIDDSDGEFGTFVGGLLCGWIEARQAAAADADETAEILLAWMENDDYGFCSDLKSEAAKVLDRAGLASFERAVRARFESACLKPEERVGGYYRDFWGQVLRSIYTQQRNIEKYLALTAQTSLTQADCEVVATIFQAKRKPDEALAWLERGIEMDKCGSSLSMDGYRLPKLRRELLAKLGRESEALDSAWAAFLTNPSKFTYDEMLSYVPKAERASWHKKAMETSEQADLSSLIELWLSVKEIERLADRLNRASDRELEGLSHYATEPAAKRLVKTHPAIAAKVFRALCVRILNAGKSKYYDAALANIEAARRCYLAAGFDEMWRKTAAEIRRDHYRKYGFMPGFEAIVAGKRALPQPSFLDRARAQWASKGK